MAENILAMQQEKGFISTLPPDSSRSHYKAAKSCFSLAVAFWFMLLTGTPAQLEMLKMFSWTRMLQFNRTLHSKEPVNTGV